MRLLWRRPLRRRLQLRNLRASFRDTLVLVHEFQGTVVGFVVVLLVGGLLYARLSALAGRPMSLAESNFLVLSMIFLQANAEFPQEWYRQIFFFLMPGIGLALLARGAEFGVLLFNRRLRGEAWQVAVASTYSDHVVLVGLGHLGFRVARELVNLGNEVVVVERDPQADLLAEAAALKLPIIQADGTKAETLQAAGAPRAAAIVLCTSNDTLNLQIALKARTLNARARIMVRVFDDDFARQIERHFGIDLAFSASSLAAPAVAGAATQYDVSSPIALAGRTLSLARLIIRKGSALIGSNIEDFENGFDATVVLLERDGKADLHPANHISLAAGDNIAVFAEPQTLNRIARANRQSNGQLA